jgi:hypothetical protein
MRKPKYLYLNCPLVPNDKSLSILDKKVQSLKTVCPYIEKPDQYMIMLNSYKLNPKEIRKKIRELEKVMPKNIEEYSEREDKIGKLLELSRMYG